MPGAEENKGGDIIDLLLKNPELISKAASLLSGLKPLGAGGEAGEDNPPSCSLGGRGEDKSSAGAGGMSDSSDISSKISSLLANKELMAMLPGLLSALKPQGADAKEEGGEARAIAALSSLSSSSPSGGREQPHEHDKRNALISALKPYLNGRRREAVDYLLMLEKLGNIFKTLN